MDTTFPIFFVTGALTAAGWPRRTGMRRRAVVNRLVLETIYTDLLRRGMALGAGTPPLALQLLADNFSERDWISQPADDLLLQLRATPGMVFGEPPVPVRFLIALETDDSPWEKLLTSRVSADPVPVSILESTDFLALLHWNFAVALLWGLGHPRALIRALEREQEASATSLPRFKAAGLSLPANYVPPSPREVIEESVALVTGYQSRVRALTAVPSQLASHPRIMKYLARQRIM